VYIADAENHLVRVLVPADGSCQYQVNPSVVSPTVAGGVFPIAVPDAAELFLGAGRTSVVDPQHHDEWRRSSDSSWIRSAPALLVQAKDAPVIPFSIRERPGVSGNPNIKLLAAAHGRHLGFLVRRLP
jgi:hypothetical protein